MLEPCRLARLHWGSRVGNSTCGSGMVGRGNGIVNCIHSNVQCREADNCIIHLLDFRFSNVDTNVDIFCSFGGIQPKGIQPKQ